MTDAQLTNETALEMVERLKVVAPDLTYEIYHVDAYYWRIDVSGNSLFVDISLYTIRSVDWLHERHLLKNAREKKRWGGARAFLGHFWLTVFALMVLFYFFVDQKFLSAEDVYFFIIMATLERIMATLERIDRKLKKQVSE